jgi:cytoskeletal protein RodZ
MKSLGETLRALWENRQLPLRTVAAYLDIDHAIMSRIERGQRKNAMEALKVAKEKIIYNKTSKYGNY